MNNKQRRPASIGAARLMIDEASFDRMLSIECRRSERTGDRIGLVLIDVGQLEGVLSADQVEDLPAVVSSAVRETDVTGWRRSMTSLGVILTALNGTSLETLKSVVVGRIRNALLMILDSGQAQAIPISCHMFPQEGDAGDTEDHRSDSAFHTQGAKASGERRLPALLKRSLDVAGSAAALVFLAPLFLVIAVLVKLSSPGPVLFRQERIGFGGRKFTFLKFRSMYVNSDPALHKEYTRSLIDGKVDPSGGTYKITSDPRVTPVGRVLRKCSLDELPQFLNVLHGEMSLVGPRPPIRYEFDRYALWHRRRILEAKPGMTGEWQTQGRSRTSFDEMVRMDLRYIRNQSLWLDLKILLKTPRAVLNGTGAY